MAVQTQIQTRRGTAASWTSTNPTLAAGEIGFETDTGKFKIGNGSTAWASLAYSAGATAVTYLFNATGGQTTFSGADANGLTLAYTVGAEQVYLNGVLQVRGSDYTATNGTSIVLASGALVSDVLNVIAYSAMTITDTYTQAQADAKFVQQTNNFFAGKNKIINGDFNIWQRGTASVTATGVNYNADRWLTNVGSTSGFSASQGTFTAGTAPVSGYESTYFLNVAGTMSDAAAGYIQVEQRIEDVRTFAGQTVTLSFWAKGSTSGTINTLISQNFGSGGSSPVLSSTTNHSITTSWQRFTVTYTLASISGKTIGSGNHIQVYIVKNMGTNYPTYGTSNYTGTLSIWGVQVEAGSIATPFQTATGTIQGELAACQRYYFRTVGGQVASRFSGLGGYYSTTGAYVTLIHPVTMRTNPSSVDFSTLAVYDYNADNTVTNVAITSGGASPQATLLTITVASGGTQYRPVQLNANSSTTAYIGLNAEL